MRYPPVIETERLVLRPFTMEDVPGVVEFAGSEETYRGTLCMPRPYTEEDAVKWISSHNSQFFNGTGMESAITFNRQFMGVVGLSINKEHNRAEIGYWLGKPYWGKGYTTEAVRAIVRYAFEELELNRITSRHFPHNPASGKVLEKAGFTKEGFLRSEYLKDGKYLDAVVFGYLRQDFRRVSGN